MRCWGDGALGQLGHDNQTSVGRGGTAPSIETAGDVPVGATVATAITAGGSHTCAVLTDGSVRCWGQGSSGQLGYGSPANVGDGGTDDSITTAGDVPVGVAVRIRATTRVTSGVTPKRDRRAPYVYSLSGRVRGAFAADGATCTGPVTVAVRRGTNVLKTRTTRLDASCRYSTRIRLTATDLRLHRATRLTAKMRYPGTSNLTPSHTTQRLTAH